MPFSIKNFQKWITLLFCLFLFLLTVTWNLPVNPLNTRYQSILNFFIPALGLRQNWGMFSGVGAGSVDLLRIVVELPNRERYILTKWDFSQPNFSRNPLRGVTLNAVIYLQNKKYREVFLSYFCRQKINGQSPSRVIAQTLSYPVDSLDPLGRSVVSTQTPPYAIPESSYGDAYANPC